MADKVKVAAAADTAPTVPTYVWAYEDVTLPVAGGANKVKPIDDLLKKGYDKNEKPGVEEYNHILNMTTSWLNWVVTQKIPEMENDFDRKLRELENRINVKLGDLNNKIDGVAQNLADLRQYVDENFKSIREDISTLDKKVDKLREDVTQAFADMNNTLRTDYAPFLLPIGAVLPWPGQVAPDGFLECNGQAFDTGENPRLASVLGVGTVPDYRGLFLRGWAHGSAVYDPDYFRGLGSIQGDAMRAITGGTISASRYRAWDGVYGAFRMEARRWDTNYKNGGGDDWGDYISFDSSRVVPTAAEVRPNNVAVMYIIKTDKASSSGGTSPTGISLSTTNIENRVGYTARVVATVLPVNIGAQYPVSWESQDPSVATVDGNGNVVLVGPGETNIVASISTGMTNQVRIVSYEVMTAVTIQDPGPISAGTSVVLNLTKTPATSNEPVEYLTSAASVATVNTFGLVTGVSVGTATITVRGKYSGTVGTRQISVTPAIVDTTVQDIEYGEVTVADFGTGYNQVPSGCTIVGGDWATDPAAPRLGYAPLMKKIDDVWVQVAGK